MGSLRILSLNCFEGRTFELLQPFLEGQGKLVDMICLQGVSDASRDGDQALLEERHPGERVRAGMFRDIAKVLPGFDGEFMFSEDRLRMGVATFWRAGLVPRRPVTTVVHEPTVEILHGSDVRARRKMMQLVAEHDGRRVLVVNVHGLYSGGGKDDTPDRLEQSRNIRAVMDGHKGPKILVGDLNLAQETESLAILGEGMQDLIRRYRVTDTRTPLYRHYDKPSYTKHADYAFVSPELRVLDFRVLPDVVSDHAPLSLEVAFPDDEYPHFDSP